MTLPAIVQRYLEAYNAMDTACDYHSIQWIAQVDALEMNLSAPGFAKCGRVITACSGNLAPFIKGARLSLEPGSHGRRQVIVNQMLGDDDIALGIDEYHEFDSARNKRNGGVRAIAQSRLGKSGHWA